MNYQELNDEYEKLVEEKYRLLQDNTELSDQAASSSNLVRIKAIEEQLQLLESQAKTLDCDIYQRLLLLDQCAMMDALPLAERKQSVLFSNAMTALEGIPARELVKQSLQDWVNGIKNFSECYLSLLVEYHLQKNRSEIG